MMGNFHGPGGSLEVELTVLDDLFRMFRTTNTKRKKLRRIGKEGSWRSMKKTQRKIRLMREKSLMIFT